jgi:primosomal protein N'
MLPPFSSMIELMVESKDANLAFEEAKKIVDKLKGVSKSSKILGPAEAPLFKKNDIFRFVITIMAIEDSVLNEIKNLYPIYQSDKNININITRY